MYSCLPPDRKCEWSELRYFVADYNKKNKTNFKLEECLDVKDDKNAQPEIRLADTVNRQHMVIEKKIIVWPKNRIKNHKHEHRFIDLINNLLENILSKPGLYIFKFTSPENWSKKEEQEYFNTIKEEIIKKRELIETGDKVIGRIPFFWFIKKIKDKKNIQTYFEWIPYSPNLDESEDFQNALTEIKYIIKDHLKGTEKKFQSHTNDLKILLFYPYTDIYFGETIIDIIFEDIIIPSLINEIWLAKKEYINDDGDYIYKYNRIEKVCSK